MPALLIRADHVWRTVQGMLRITVGRGARDELPEASAARAAARRRRGAATAGPVDLAGLRATLDASGATRCAPPSFDHVGEIEP